MKIAALVSGGVDSSVTVHLLKEMGYDPTIFYIKIGLEDEPGYVCPKEEDIEITSYIAKKYGCKMEIVDLQKEYYDTVIKYTLDTVKKGLTPNPDIMCNSEVKFKVFLDELIFRYLQTKINSIPSAKIKDKQQTTTLNRKKHRFVYYI